MEWGKPLEIAVRLVAALQFTGAMILLIAVLRRLITGDGAVFVVIVLVAFTAYAILGLILAYRAIRLYASSARRLAAFMLAQVPIIQTSVIAYWVYMGSSLTVQWRVPDPTVILNWSVASSTYTFDLLYPQSATLLGVNVAALIQIGVCRAYEKRQQVTDGSRRGA